MIDTFIADSLYVQHSLVLILAGIGCMCSMGREFVHTSFGVYLLLMLDVLDGLGLWTFPRDFVHTPS